MVEFTNHAHTLLYCEQRDTRNFRCTATLIRLLHTQRAQHTNKQSTTLSFIISMCVVVVVAVFSGNFFLVKYCAIRKTPNAILCYMSMLLPSTLAVIVAGVFLFAIAFSSQSFWTRKVLQANDKFTTNAEFEFEYEKTLIYSFDASQYVSLIFVKCSWRLLVKWVWFWLAGFFFRCCRFCCAKPEFFR